MNQITQILNRLDADNFADSNELLPLVYEELRKLATSKLQNERSDHTLQPTALVHEAWLRIIGDAQDHDRKWNSRRHFFGAASEAMRRILVDHARAALAKKRGGDRYRIQLETWNHPASEQPEKMLELDEALQKLGQQDELKAQLVELRFFAGLTVKEAAAALEISTASAERYWAYARAWLHTEMQS